MKNLNVSPEELYRLVEQFVETLSDKEYTDTKKNICWMIFDDFKEWYWKDEIDARHQRYEQYLKLKREFEPDKFYRENSAEAIQEYLNMGKFK